MAIKLIANYAKRLGLPGYSSHQYSVSMETEIASTDDIQGECSRLYQLLQSSVDREIQETGFVPPDGYGMQDHPVPEQSNGTTANGQNGQNGHTNGNGNSHASSRSTHWRCSEKQRELIEKIVRENALDKNEVEQLSIDMFGDGVKTLDRLSASGLIDELLDRYGKRQGNGNRRSRAFAPRNGRTVRS